MSTSDNAASSSKQAEEHRQQQQQPPPGGDSRMPEQNDDEPEEKIPQLPNPVCTPAQVANTLSTQEMENLFIDMSFYARLGFLQAPSCLKCAYRDEIGRAHV